MALMGTASCVSLSGAAGLAVLAGAVLLAGAMLLVHTTSLDGAESLAGAATHSDLACSPVLDSGMEGVLSMRMPGATEQADSSNVIAAIEIANGPCVRLRLAANIGLGIFTKPSALGVLLLIARTVGGPVQIRFVFILPAC
jgi:hypothetical protein